MAVTGAQVLGGRYVLGEVLGTGGMATVRRARDQVLRRDVAVKILSPQYAEDPGFLARFEREARHAARLSHPRLVTVFDCGIDGGTAFIVMELVAGRTLRHVLDHAGTLSPGKAVAIAAAVCEALEVAHAAGLVHRDIKPANIVVSGDEVKVLDFGIARAGGSAGSIQTAGVLGTATYLSPEQAFGGHVGPQADLYALGCVLFEMLTGTPPFTGDSAVGVAYRHVHDYPGPPSVRRPGLPPKLDWIIGRLLAKDPADRPQDAAAAKAGLLAALAPDATAIMSAPIDAVPPAPGRDAVRSAPGRRPRRVTRSEMVLGGALAAAVAALAAVLATGTAGQAAPGASPPSPSAATTHQAPTPHPSAHPSAHKSAHRLVRHAGPKRSAAAHADALPPAAAAAAAFVGDLQAGVADGQVTQQAGQDLFKLLQPLLFGPPDRTAQQIRQQYAALVQAYDQRRSQGQITGAAATTLHQALGALGAAVAAS